jgi:glycosyltransferase involved in cell wall biosynthesis
VSTERKKIAWITFLILDTHLHKTSRLEILKSLAALGYNTELVAVSSRSKVQDEDLPLRIISIPLRYVPIISPIVFASILLFFLPFYVVISKPNVIITEPDFSTLSFMPILPLFRFKKVKLFLDVRSTPVETRGFRGYVRSICFNISLFIARNFFDGITIITPLMKEEVCRKFKLNPKSVGVWSSGVDTALFNPQDYAFEAQQLRDKLGLSQKFVIFYHGAFSQNRGLIETIEAIDDVKNEVPQTVLFLLGNGAITADLKKSIIAKGLQDKVIIHEPVKYSDVPKYIAMSDICIVPLPDHPYWRYQCPLNLLEYLAMEKVIIVTNIPAHRFIIDQEKCAIYIRSTIPSEIAKAIKYAYHNKDKLGDWGMRGRQIIEKNYTWKKIAMELEKYLFSTKESNRRS